MRTTAAALVVVAALAAAALAGRALLPATLVGSSPSPMSTATERVTATADTDRAPLAAFARDYSAVRSEESTARRAVAPPVAGSRTMLDYYTAQLGITVATADRLEHLDRPPIARSFIDAAIGAIELRQQADVAYVRGAMNASDPVYQQAPDLMSRSARAWRQLSDSVEDALRAHGLTWADVGGRPQD